MSEADTEHISTALLSKQNQARGAIRKFPDKKESASVSSMSPIYEDNEVEPFKEVEDKRKTQNEENFEEEVIRAVSTASGQESTTNPVEVTESGQKASNRTRQIVMPKRFEDYYTGFMPSQSIRNEIEISGSAITNHDEEIARGHPIRKGQLL
ncbi:hypothetical protein ACJJTC_001232 [Scirpophaga incertulas]